MITFEPINLRNCSEYQKTMVWKLYKSSFPKEERRTSKEQQLILNKANYHPMVYIKDQQIIGLLFYWEFGAYTYIEHFAIAEHLRGQSYGSLIFKDFIKNRAQVFLEIEPVCDTITEKRFQFYKKLGFVLNPHKHLQIVFGKHTPQNFRLDILSKQLISEDDYKKLYTQMQKELP